MFNQAREVAESDRRGQGKLGDNELKMESGMKYNCVYFRFSHIQINRIVSL